MTYKNKRRNETFATITNMISRVDIVPFYNLEKNDVLCYLSKALTATFESNDMVRLYLGLTLEALGRAKETTTEQYFIDEFDGVRETLLRLTARLDSSEPIPRRNTSDVPRAKFEVGERVMIESVNHPNLNGPATVLESDYGRGYTSGPTGRLGYLGWVYLLKPDKAKSRGIVWAESAIRKMPEGE